MTNTSDSDINRLYKSVLEIYPDSVFPEWRGGWPNRADLALLDAIYSTRQKYETAVLPRVKKWQTKYPSPSVPELEYLSNMDASDIEKILGKNTLPGVRLLGSKRGKRKSEGVKEVAKLLCSPEVGLGSAEQIILAVERTDSSSVLALLQRTKGVGQATASYFLILLGIDGVKVDTLLGSWVRNQMDNQNMSSEQISELVAAVASEKFNCDAKVLDYAIWRHESARRARRKTKRNL